MTITNQVYFDLFSLDHTKLKLLPTFPNKNNIVFVVPRMKTGSYFFNPERSPSFKIIVSKVFITMKFPCRLFLEYHLQEEVVRSREIRIEPKERGYVLDEEISGEGID